jgi:F-box domain
MAVTLLGLPTEVIILTLCHLPLRELVACKRLCRRLNALIEDSQFLQYHLRAMLSGVEDVFVPGVCSSEFLERLKEWEMAWWKFDIGDHFARHRYHNVLWTVEHIVQNGYIAAMRLGDSSWHTAPGWSYADISQVLSQGNEGRQESSWKDIQLDRSITPKGYVLDVNQNLVAVVCWLVPTSSGPNMLNFSLFNSRDANWRQMQVRFLSFTTGLPHDLASHVIPELELNCKSSNDSEITMEVMGPYLIMIVTYKIRLRLSGRHQRIYFVDWTKGHIHCVSLQGVNLN